MTKKELKEMQVLIIGILTDELGKNEQDHQDHLTLRQILKEYEGKKLTARVQTKLPEGFTYRVKDKYSTPEIVRPDGNSHYICDQEQLDNFQIKYFEDRDTPYNRGARERADKLAGILQSPTLLQMFARTYLRAKKAYQEMQSVASDLGCKPLDSYNNPAYYTILKQLGMQSERFSDFKYKS